jgi:hypothetical protein
MKEKQEVSLLYHAMHVFSTARRGNRRGNIVLDETKLKRM